MIRVGIAGIGFMGMVHWLSYAEARGVKVTALCEQNKKRREGDPMVAFGQEVKAVVRAVRSGTISPILDARLALDALILCEKQTRSLQTGKMVRV